jgi:hypothetical protein
MPTSPSKGSILLEALVLYSPSNIQHKAASPAVKDGAPDLGALDVLQRVAICPA